MSRLSLPLSPLRLQAGKVFVWWGLELWGEEIFRVEKSTFNVEGLQKVPFYKDSTMLLMKSGSVTWAQIPCGEALPSGRGAVRSERRQEISKPM